MPGGSIVNRANQPRRGDGSTDCHPVPNVSGAALLGVVVFSNTLKIPVPGYLLRALLAA